MEFYLTLLAISLGAYVLGSIPSAVWIGKRFYGIDVREHGSGNAGATNVLRVLGKKAALPVFGLDILKGFVAIQLSWFLDSQTIESNNIFTLYRILLGVICVVGHIFPVFAKFRGGKGVATLAGVLIGLHPTGVLIALIVFLCIFFSTRFVSLGSMLGGVAFMLYTLLTPYPISFFSDVQVPISLKIFSVIVSILLFITHRKNISRLLAGTESKTTFKK